PDKDIALTYLGCRPGEKLTEELVADHETVESTTVQKVLCIRPNPARNFAQLSGLVARLEESAAEGHVSKVLALLCAILPTYCPAGTLLSQERGGETDALLSEIPAQSPAGIETVAGLAPAAPHRRK
ncbi:MAG: polysaccharide biosynthesis protein, partial [Nitrospira sp.]